MILIDRTSDRTLADQIVDQLAQRIKAGKLPEGSRLPSVRQLASSNEVSQFTVVTAYERLVAKGLVESKAGKGNFVARQHAILKEPGIEVAAPSLMSAEGFAHQVLATEEPILPASSGFLPADWFEGVINPAAVKRLLKPGAEGTLAAPVQGSVFLREQLSIRLSQWGVNVPPSQFLVTHGATHAFEIIARCILPPNAKILIDDPGYFVVRRQLEQLGHRCIPVPRLVDGPDLDALQQLAIEHQPAAMFTQTLLHNPSGGNTSLSKSHKLLSLANQFDFYVIEDNVYGDLANHTSVLLAQLDEFQRVFHVGSFTKVLNPGMRVGYVVPPLRFLSDLQMQKMLTVLTGSALNEALVAECLVSGRFRKHLQQLKSRLDRARVRALGALQQTQLTVVSGQADGMFLWVKLPEGESSDAWAKQAQQAGILLASGTLFSMTNSGDGYIRLNTAYAGDHQLVKFFQQMMKAKKS